MSRLYITGNAVDQNEIPVVGAQVYVFAGGVLAELQDAAGNDLPNPVITIADGFFEAYSPSTDAHVLEYRWGGKVRYREALSDTERAQAAAQAALAAAGAPSFPSTAAGLAGVEFGQTFYVVTAGVGIIYRKDAGPVATEISRFIVNPQAANGSSLVGFQQTGTGAVTETAQTTLRRTVFASQYNTPQAAIDALPNTGGVVIVDAMFNVTDLRVNGTARNKQNVTLRGNGWGTGFRMPNGGMTNASRTNLLDMEGAVNCVIENMTLDGNRANQTIPSLTDGPDYEKFNLVYMEATADCAVRGCNIINAAVIGVNPGAPWVGKTGSDRVEVSGNTFRNSKNPIAAMRIRRGSFESNTLFGVFADEDYGIVIDEFSTGCLVSDNDISDMGDVGIFLFRASDCVVQGNRVTNCLVSIALNDASNDNVVIGNECDDAQNTHIQLKNDCRRNKIRNNDLTTAAQYCIVLESGTGGSAFNEIVGNTCRLASFSNIAVFDAAFTQVESNRCSEAVGSGIYIQGACDWSEVNDNYCFNNSTGSANDAGIRLVGQNNITVEDNKCFDSQGTKTQNWGIRCNESFVGSVTIIGNDVRQNKTAGMAISGGTPIVKFNLGWITEASGQIALGAAATAVTVTHGMNMPPNLQLVRVTLYDATVRTTRALYVGNVGPTTFEIRADVAPGADTLITWEAKAYV